jgi:hypothetical protein
MSLADWNVPPLMDVLAAAVNICGPFIVRAASVRTALAMDMVREARAKGSGVSIN